MRRRHPAIPRVDIETAVKHLRAGAMIAYPTETFYALGVDAMNPDAVDRLRALKQREQKPLSVVIAHLAMLDRIALPMSDSGRKLAAAFWPGPLTLVVAAHETVPLNLRAGGWSLAARHSSHIVACALATGLGGPITSTSCNLPGQTEPRRPEEIAAEVLARVAGVVDGAAPGGRPSSIVDVGDEPPRLLRAGAISEQALRQVAPSLILGEAAD